MKVINYNPGYYNKYVVFIPYEKKYYCNENKIIHQNEKELSNCKFCNK